MPTDKIDISSMHAVIHKSYEATLHAADITGRHNLGINGSHHIACSSRVLN